MIYFIENEYFQIGLSRTTVMEVKFFAVNLFTNIKFTNIHIL